MKKTVLALSVILALVLSNRPAQAHVLLTDQTRSRGAVLHIIPDDDPIAGEPARLYFDMQNSDGADRLQNPEVRISDSTGATKYISMDVDGTLATAQYIFPSQGVYELVFFVGTDGNRTSFVHTQRIARDTAQTQPPVQPYVWAEALLLASVLGCGILLIVAFNRRRSIASQSHF